MTEQQAKALRFGELHIKGDPLVIFNIWDAGSAHAVAAAGAKALGTGSWSVAAANGYADGEDLPIDLAIENIRRISAAVDLPVSLDFEGGYAADPEMLKINAGRVLDAGAVGINFEDSIVGDDGTLYSTDKQCLRIAALREAGDPAGVAFFINARTDLFLVNVGDSHEAFLDEAVERSRAYAEAGARGFFAPGLKEPRLIERLCEASPLPVNIMVMPDTPTNAEMAALGVARISYGPGPYRQMMAALTEAARLAIGSSRENA